MAPTDKDQSSQVVKFFWINKSQINTNFEEETFVVAYQAVKDKMGEAGVDVLKEVLIR